MSDEPKKIEIKHLRSDHFTSDFATGVIVSGPTPDGFYHVIFYADAVALEKETAVRSEDGAYKIGIEPPDVLAFREDKTRISMPHHVLQGFVDLLGNRYGIRATQDTDADGSKA